jgi:hypothetical protein
MDFKMPRMIRFRLAFQPVLLIGAALFMLAIAIVISSVLFIVFSSLLIVGLLMSEVWIRRTQAHFVHVSESGLSARTIYGRRAELDWSEIREIQWFSTLTQRGRSQRVRLLRSGLASSLIVSDLLDGFPQLAEEIKKHTSHAQTTNLRLWERVLLTW